MGDSHPNCGTSDLLATTFADRYRIEHELGARGMVVTLRDSLSADQFSMNNGESWDVFPNGREFLFQKGPPIPQGKLYLLVNWQQMLGKAGGAEAAP